VLLESLRVMPGVPVKDGTELFRHGVEMTVTGSYFDLLEYLNDLEKLPGRLLWGPVELQADKYPEVRLTLQVHTLSTQRSLGL
jgi:MSHA biogenesis protein MshJ